MDEIDLDFERLKLELIRVRAGRAEQEFLVKQKELEISRLKASIQISLVKESEVEKQISDRESV